MNCFQCFLHELRLLSILCSIIVGCCFFFFSDSEMWENKGENLILPSSVQRQKSFQIRRFETPDPVYLWKGVHLQDVRGGSAKKGQK